MISKIIIRHDELNINGNDVRQQLAGMCTAVKEEMEMIYLRPPGKVLEVLALLRKRKIAYTAKFNSTDA